MEARGGTDPTRAAVVIDHIVAGQLSVSFNRHLARYLAVHSNTFSRVSLR